MDDGTYFLNKGVRLCTNNFSITDLTLLREVLKEKYNLKTSIHKTGTRNKSKEEYGIYIWKSSMNQLITLVIGFAVTCINRCTTS